MIAKIVIGLQFGDEGKGRVVDYLCSFTSSPIVVRFSGGQQVGHTVMFNNIKHVHSNFGSGSLRGVPTYYTEHCCAYLNSMSVEREILLNKGVAPEIIFHPFIKMTTPYDQAFGRLLEKKNNHGSCGMGIGSTMNRHLTTGYKLHAIDLKNKHVALAKLPNIKQYYLDKAKLLGFTSQEFFDMYKDDEEYYFDQLDHISFKIEDYNFLKDSDYRTLIFEGSQGILLDMDHGFFPNVTYANTVSKNAIEICNILEIDLIDFCYVTRCYQTRHGNGWMSDTGEILLINNEEEINVTNEWQGNFRIKELDYSLINHSLDIDSVYHKDSHICQDFLYVTCLDQRPDFSFDPKRINKKFEKIISFYGPKNTNRIVYSVSN